MKGGRFIAGAVCAACGATDRIVVEYSIDAQRQRCVVCGQTEAIHDEQSMNTGKARQPALIASSRGTPAIDSDSTDKLDERYD